MDRVIRRLSKETKTPPAEAADKLDKTIHDLLRKLRQGKPAELPGLGKFLPGPELRFRFDNTSRGKDARAKSAR